MILIIIFIISIITDMIATKALQMITNMLSRDSTTKGLG